MQIILVILYIALSWIALGKVQGFLGIISFSTFAYRLIFSMILGWILIPIWLLGEVIGRLAKGK